MRSKSSISASWLALTSFAAYKLRRQNDPQKMGAKLRTVRRTPIPAMITFAGRNACVIMSEMNFKPGLSLDE